MNVLILGSGGREHALAYAVSQSQILSALYCIPGNPGIAQLATCIDGNPCDLAFIDKIVKANNIDLIIPGSENVLLTGIADFYKDSHIMVFGPSKASLVIESSKGFAKELMSKYHIPTADYQSFSEYGKAIDYVNTKGVPIVIKYNGLASGKGVVVATCIKEAQEALLRMLEEKVFGDEGVIIEEFLEGYEFSLMCFVHNDLVIPMPIAQDHKRAYTGNIGPMTGGMGVYCPVPTIEDSIIVKAMHTIMMPVAKGLVQEGRGFTGFLYGGLIATKDGPKVIEFNARFGDPEAEVILPKLKSDILVIINQLMRNEVPIVTWDNAYYLGVVLASIGYPGHYEVGIALPNKVLTDTRIFHMGTKSHNNQLISNGGRVMCVIGEGKTLKEAQQVAYDKASKMTCHGLFYRLDIGYQSLDKD